ncbi:MAG: N-6 DNA methylase [Selenomonadaceae bacterium]|nr:N-6 DNA methylase [Selenomonadaceae bacterium]
MAQSAEPQIANLANGWLKEYGLDFKLEQESLNHEIDTALTEYASKGGGRGGNRPDAKLLLFDKYNNPWPIIIEYKGYKDKLVKLNADNQVDNRNKKNEPNYRNIKEYAINGAVHYANALIHYTQYEHIIAVGMTGYKDNFGKLQYEISVYLVSKDNFALGQEVGKFSDFSFLKSENFDAFIERVKSLKLTEQERQKAREKRENEISVSLMKLNNDIYQNEDGISEKDRVYLVAAVIMATLGEKNISPLEKNDLKSKNTEGFRDGDIILNQINAFLKVKKLPEEKHKMILRTLANTLTNEIINKPLNGESQLKRIFSKIVDDLGIYYKIGLTVDFTGKLFNEMYRWLGFSQDKLNDVVLTPSYVATLLVKLTRVNKDSYVWDFATGSAGLLVAAMNEMIKDATDKINSPDELKKKISKIKLTQLLGVEILQDIYMLAVLNMILMGDGCSNIANRNSLNDFDGEYVFADEKNKKFPADVFVLNPPYSSPGKGMIFVEKALSMMTHGYAAIIIQTSAGSGKAAEFNRRILKHSTLLASIKMPDDLFVGKSSVQTRVYVFRVGEAHNKDDIVKFIDFSEDGYTRTNRKNTNVNLRDTNNAKGRYEEVINLVRYGKNKLKIFTEKEYYEGNIDPENGADWNQIAPLDITPTDEDFKSTVSNYLSWEITNIIRQNGGENELKK